jgi:hypothetical protein
LQWALTNNDFSRSTGNSTNNSEATIWQHTLLGKVLRNIDLVDRNYNLESDLLETQEKMAALLYQNKLLQGQLAAQYTVHAKTDSYGQEDDFEEELALIRGGGTDWGEQDKSSPEGHNY